MQNVIEQFTNQFQTSDDCLQYIVQMKWPNGFECPRCASKQYYLITTRNHPLYECRSCGHQTSLTSGTIMEKSRTSVLKWMLAIFLFTHPEVKGLNAVTLASVINVTYKTAWAMLNKIRQAVSCLDNAAPLDGRIDAIVAAYCRPRIGSLLPHPKESPVIIGANLNEATLEATAVKMKIPDRTLLRASNSNTLFREGEHWFTSSHSSEHAAITYIHRPIDRRLQTNALRQLAKQAQKWIARTYRGISRAYLQYYLDEFCFRYNHVIKSNQAKCAFDMLCEASLLIRPCSGQRYNNYVNNVA